MTQRERKAWKLPIYVIAIGVPALLATEAIVGMIRDDRETEQAASQVVVADSLPPVSVVDECNRYAGLERDAEAQVAVGAGPDERVHSSMDAGAGAIRHGDPGDSGTLVGLSLENGRSASARTAYRECMARRGYAS